MTTDPRAASLMSTERRPRKSSAEVRQAMLETAVKAVNAAGLTVSLDHISMDAVILEAGVARSAAYRVWPQRSAFIMDLLIEVARSPTVTNAAYDPESLRTALEAVRPWKTKLTDISARRAALVETCRTGVLRNYEALSMDRAWQTDITLRATIMSVPADRRHELMTALDESVAAYVDTLAQFYEHMSNVLGYEMAAGRNYTYLAAAGSAIVEGMLLRSAGLFGSRSPDTPDLGAEFEADPFDIGSTQKWNGAAVSFTGTVLALVRPTPEYDPATFDTWFDQADKMVHALEADPDMQRKGQA